MGAWGASCSVAGVEAVVAAAAICLCHRYTAQLVLIGIAAVCVTPLIWRFVRGRTRSR